MCSLVNVTLLMVAIQLLVGPSFHLYRHSNLVSAYVVMPSTFGTSTATVRVNGDFSGSGRAKTMIVPPSTLENEQIVDSSSVASNQIKSLRQRQQPTKIESLQQFRNHITSDVDLKRYTVVKFHAPWCKTCAKFALKFNKLVSAYGDFVPPTEEMAVQSLPFGPIRFASVEYSPSLRPLFGELGVDALPTVHVYDSDGDLVAEYRQPQNSAEYQKLQDQLKRYAMSFEASHTAIGVSSAISLTSSKVEDGVPALPVSTYSPRIKSTDDEFDRTNHLIVGDKHKKRKSGSKRALIQQTALNVAMQLSYRSRSFDDVGFLTLNELSTSTSRSFVASTSNRTHRPWWKRLRFHSLL